ncbi:MAG: SDR family NAD(P)-dependent oxidoreductase, partial [Mycobacteriales bacterium]
MADDVAERYGPWAVVAGASDGTGAAFATEIASHGINVVLVARRKALLEELAARLPVETRVVVLDLSESTAIADLLDATRDLEVGLLVYNAGADSVNRAMLAWQLDELRALIQRNCTSVLEASYGFGGEMVKRGR